MESVNCHSRLRGMAEVIGSRWPELRTVTEGNYGRLKIAHAKTHWQCRSRDDRLPSPLRKVVCTVEEVVRMP